MSRRLFITISLLALLILAGIPAVSAEYYTVAPVIRQGGTVYMGEQGLNITGALNLDNTYHTPGNKVIGWWATWNSITNTPPYKTIDLAGYDSANFTISQSDFFGETGNWYLINASTGFGILPPVFVVADPNLEVQIWNFRTETDVTGRVVAQGDPLGFRIITNMYPALDFTRRGPVYNDNRDGYIDIRVKDEAGSTLYGLYNNEAGLQPLRKQNVTSQPWTWGSPSNPMSPYNWSTDARDPGIFITPPGRTLSGRSPGSTT